MSVIRHSILRPALRRLVIREPVRRGYRLFRRPGFAISVILTLALGIAANTATLSMLYGYLLAPLPYPHAERLVEVYVTSRAFPGNLFGVSYDTYRDLRSSASGIIDAGLSEPRSFNLQSGSWQEHVQGAAVSSSLFATLGVRPVLGRVFGVGAERPGAVGQAVLSYRLWRQLFDGNSDALGRIVRLNGAAYAVIGVMPAQFEHGSAVWVPLVPPQAVGGASALPIGQGTLVARLGPSLTPHALEVQARSVLTRRNAHDSAALHATLGWFGPQIAVRPLRVTMLRHLVHRLDLAQWAAGLLLALVWFNLANLFIVRALARRDELLMRRVLGADGWTLFRELLLENLLLCGLGGAVGLIGGHALLGVLWKTGFGNTQFTFQMHIWDVSAVIAVGLSLLSALSFSLAGLSFIRRDLARGLKQADAHSAGGRGELRARTALVTAQLALAAALCGTGAMLVHGLMRLERIQLGFEPAQVLTLEMYFPPDYVATSSALASLLARIHAAVAGLPGVQAATIANQIPFGRNPMCNKLFPYSGARSHTPVAGAQFGVVADAGYFRTLGVPLLGGRVFAQGTGQASMIIDARAAKALFGTTDAVGSLLTFDPPASGRSTPKGAVFPVVGIVGNTRFAYTLTGLTCDGVVYRSLSQFLRAQGSSPWNATPWYLAVRSPTPTAVLLPMLHRVLTNIAPGVPAYDVQTLDQRVAEGIRPHRRVVTLGLLLASGALAIAALGLYAVQSYAVTRRRAEFGIRSSLGATRNRLLGLVLRETVGVLIVGLAVGLTGTAALGKLFAGALYGGRPFDPPAMLLAVAVLTATALLAGGIPAWRASRWPPGKALRDE